MQAAYERLIICVLPDLAVWTMAPLFHLQIHRCWRFATDLMVSCHWLRHQIWCRRPVIPPAPSCSRAS